MEEKNGKDTIDSYDDFLDGVGEFARRSKEKSIEENVDRLKDGEELSPDMGSRIRKA